MLGHGKERELIRKSKHLRKNEKKEILDLKTHKTRVNLYKERKL